MARQAITIWICWRKCVALRYWRKAWPATPGPCRRAALKMATLNGAKALGLEAEIGSLVIGKAADVTAIDLSDLETQPVYNPLSQLVYAAGRHQVTDVWVAGKQLLNQRQLTTVHLPDLQARVAVWRERLREK